MTEKINALAANTGTRFFAGIIVTVALMLLVTFAGINYMAKVNMRMKDIVDNNNVKMEMAHVMQNALRERALNMYIMTIVEDDFLKDEEYQRFNIHGTEYYQARKNLESLAATPEEKVILSKIGSLTRSTQPEVQEIVEFLLKGNTRRYYEVIRNRIMPRQKLINDQVIELVALQKNQTRAAVSEAESSYEYARELMLVLGVIASLLVILIATLVGRKVSKQAHELQHQAFHDVLTSLPNRALFLDRLAHAINRSHRDGVSFTIILLDLDTSRK